jgi:putative transposase
MSRKARFDAPGALHHIVRGIKRGRIFTDERERNNFVKRLRSIVIGTQFLCSARVLLRNHAYILFLTGRISGATVMKRLLAGWVV